MHGIDKKNQQYKSEFVSAPFDACAAQIARDVADC